MRAGDDVEDITPRWLDAWARHGVEELTEREAEERAELGEPADEPGAA